MIQFTDRGLYCQQANVYIDPWRPVKNALITHGHSDHARYGHKNYMATKASLPIIKYRLGTGINITGVNYGEKVNINGVEVSFHPAGHIVGSAQIRMEYKGEVWVISGDYKLQNDGISTPFEPLKCHHFVSESTFGLPVFKWKSQESVMNEINAWWADNAAIGKFSIIGAYALGKAQRIINNIDSSLGPILTHGAIENTNEVLRSQGVYIQKTIRVEPSLDLTKYVGALVVATPSAINSNWVKKFKSHSDAIASGWMAIRGTRRRRSVDKGFILSDHCDWDELNTAIGLTGAENVYATHGYTDIYAKYLNSKGLNAQIVKTEFLGDDDAAPDVED